MSSEVAVAQNVFELVNSQESFFRNVSSSDAVKWEKESQFAIQQLQNNSFTQGVAMKNQTSLQNAIINVSAIGISLNPALKHAYLVPRKGGVCLDLSYMGLLHLAQSSGVILWGQCKIVRANDTYQNAGLSKEPSHLSNTFGDRGEIVGAYCTVKTVDGDFLTEEMSIAEIFEIRERSEAFKRKSGPWKTDEGEMIRKTVVKRAYKYWPKCERLGSAIQMLNDNGEGIQQEKDISPFVENPIRELQDLLIDKDPNQYLPWLKVEKFEDVTEDQASAAVLILRKAR